MSTFEVLAPDGPVFCGNARTAADFAHRSRADFVRVTEVVGRSIRQDTVPVERSRATTCLMLSEAVRQMREAPVGTWRDRR